MIGSTMKNTIHIIREDDGTMIVDTKGKILKLIPEQGNIEPADESLSILNGEVINMLHNAKLRKAYGPDKVPSEFLKLLGVKEEDLLVDLFNTIYKTGNILEQWLTSTFITLSKKKDANHCSIYRIIVLISHTLKLFSKIIHRRICIKL